MFSNISTLDIWILGGFIVFTLVADFALGLIGAKWGGAHWKSVFWGVIGLILGTLLFPMPILGSLAGMFLGVFISELARTNNAGQANRAAVGSFIGSVAGFGFKLIAVFVFIILFVILAIW